MGNNLTAGARLLLCGILAFGALNLAIEGSFDSHAIAAPGGGGGGPGGGGGGPGGGGGGPGGPGGGGEGANGGSGGNNGNDKGVGNGAAASSAGSLNSAKASPNARAHAAAPSRVALLAEFEKLAVELQGLQATYDSLMAARDTLNAASPTAQEIAEAEATLRDAGLLADGETLSDVDPVALDNAITGAENQVAAAMGEAATVQQALIDMLEPAANKEVTPNVVDSVLGWLGISN